MKIKQTKHVEFKVMYIKDRDSTSLRSTNFMTNSYIDPKTVSIKDHVVNDQKVHFSFFRDNQFWYKTDLGFVFPISLEEVQSSKVTLLQEDKALLFMRWMIKYIESCKE